MQSTGEDVFVANSPSLPRLSFRSLRGEQDASALFHVHELCADCDQIDPLSSIEYAPTLDSLTGWLAEIVRQKQTQNWLVAQIGDTVVGYSRIIWWTEGDGTWVYLTVGWVVPVWRGQGIGTARAVFRNLL